MNYYNEFDRKAAQWIRELIKEGVIPEGIVDERSITDVRADELRGFTQCHFFAGVGGWPFALRLAGIPDDFPCWTGSCPCQPFSNAGKREGVKDERDLWPVFGKLIAECKPEYVFGEQVASAIKLGWIDRVHSDLEREGYACGEVVLGAHSVGANHIRQRLYWGAARMANNVSGGCREGGEFRGLDEVLRTEPNITVPTQESSLCIQLSDSESLRRGEGHKDSGKSPQSTEQIHRPSDSGHDVQLSDSDSQRRIGQSVSDERRSEMSEATGSSKPCGMAYDNSPGQRELRRGESVSPELASAECARLSNLSPWSDFGLVLCRDTDKQGRHRVRRGPAESLLQRVADGIPEDLDRMRYQSIFEHPERAFPLCSKDAVPGMAMLLKGYGNAIVPELAAEFIKAFLKEIKESEEV